LSEQCERGCQVGEANGGVVRGVQWLEFCGVFPKQVEALEARGGLWELGSQTRQGVSCSFRCRALRDDPPLVHGTRSLTIRPLAGVCCCLSPRTLFAMSIPRWYVNHWKLNDAAGAGCRVPGAGCRCRWVRRRNCRPTHTIVQHCPCPGFLGLEDGIADSFVNSCSHYPGATAVPRREDDVVPQPCRPPP